MISVCIATFNGEKYIEEQLKSILSQLETDDEIIISDDNSTDKTIEIIKGFNDSRIMFLLNKEKGYTSNFENALKQVKGDIVFLSDQDDIWENDKVRVCLEELKKYELVVSDCKIINENNQTISDSYFELRKVKRSGLGNLVKFSYLGCCLAFRADILKKALPFPPNRQLCTHDNWLFLVGAFLFRHKILNNKLILYRRHNGNVSNGGLVSVTSLGFKIKYRIYLSLFLLKRLLKNNNK